MAELLTPHHNSVSVQSKLLVLSALKALIPCRNVINFLFLNIQTTQQARLSEGEQQKFRSKGSPQQQLSVDATHLLIILIRRKDKTAKSSGSGDKMRLLSAHTSLLSAVQPCLFVPL